MRQYISGKCFVKWYTIDRPTLVKWSTIDRPTIVQLESIIVSTGMAEAGHTISRNRFRYSMDRQYFYQSGIKTIQL